ncbi:hypothetical protein A3D81_03135 [Candidatus Curtissbacteria bacterium RIFCSPHIGHO2_02_FULL_40_17]|uniref:Uncharacterized protein n=4 Tax=Candidatus Curtissiibacteriota TaxID=1752717 RepID=A0A1F5GJN4_9BACT|nr:MAG: hypothetical protein A2693_02610 [Candidatus Curtissbacteria bacterium RIFCSPHIGHO2_01_FULL_40_12]OGD92035.1 MAG: hypothetical protein A3D81_03135 [Candidatus Curtissbacteria bacterium RIFCSPHIGHO2_02_FULL_40_17]OGE05608.1 MAG: hypothetical protein A3F45_00120 [Candidatus Curtissbacteria bacterium RIFCSPHIGHO2_12_FULL_41_17]OGE07342.1 MAG: hypothetical protein A3I53_01965 [Candidatus Curtissbacteria bacterium RIFCSPLOWO2_02_FULL_40_13b]
MPLPELDTPERVIFEERVKQRLKDLAYFGSRKLDGDSSRFHILFRDEETGEIIAAFARARHPEGQRVETTEISFESQGILPSEEAVLQAVDILLETNLGTPMICDESILDELRGDSLQMIDEGHFRFIGNPRGKLEIYVPVPVNVS